MSIEDQRVDVLNIVMPPGISGTERKSWLVIQNALRGMALEINNRALRTEEHVLVRTAENVIVRVPFG